MARRWWPGWGALIEGAVALTVGSAVFALVPMLWEDDGWAGVLDRAEAMAVRISLVAVGAYLAKVRRQRRDERRAERE